jgi:hypothetical protein
MPDMAADSPLFVVFMPTAFLLTAGYAVYLRLKVARLLRRLSLEGKN